MASGLIGRCFFHPTQPATLKTQATLGEAVHTCLWSTARAHWCGMPDLSDQVKTYVRTAGYPATPLMLAVVHFASGGAIAAIAVCSERINLEPF